MKFDRRNNLTYVIMVSKFATAKIECSFGNGRVNTFGDNIYFADNGTLLCLSPILFSFISVGALKGNKKY